MARLGLCGVNCFSGNKHEHLRIHFQIRLAWGRSVNSIKYPRGWCWLAIISHPPYPLALNWWLSFRNQFPHGSLFMIIDNKLRDLKNCEHHLLSEPFNLRLLFFFWKKGMAVLSVVYLAWFLGYECSWREILVQHLTLNCFLIDIFAVRKMALR